MRVPFSRWMAVAVTAVSISAITSTGCTTVGRVPGTGWMTSWWHKTPSESYASRTPTPSAKSTPIATASVGNASAPPRDPTITPYGGNGNLAGVQPAADYGGAIPPNYATTAGGSSSYAAPQANYGQGYQAPTGTQVGPSQGPTSNNALAGGASIYGGAAPQGNSYAAQQGPVYQSADARNSSWGGQTPATGSYGAEAQGSSSIQPYGQYQGGTQPYGNPSPPPSYTPPPSYQPSGGYGGGGYGANEAPSGGDSATQPPADGYSPGSTSRYYADRQQPAPVDNAGEMFGNQNVAPASYQNGSVSPANEYNAGGNYGGGAYQGTGGYPYQ